MTAVSRVAASVSTTSGSPPGATRAGTGLDDPTLRRRRREQHSDPRSMALLATLDLPRTASCLEVGAGLGSMARRLARTVAVEGLVIATEVREEFVAALEADRPANLTVLRHDLRRDPLPAGPFDLVFSRFVLQQVPEADAVLGRLAQRLAPGGWLVIEDVTMSEEAPAGPAPYRAAMAAFAEGQQRSDYRWVRGLPARMTALGLGPVRGQQVADIFPAGSELALFWASVLRQDDAACLSTGRIGAAELATAVTGLTAGPQWFTGPAVVQCAGRRTDTVAAANRTEQPGGTAGNERR